MPKNYTDKKSFIMYKDFKLMVDAFSVEQAGHIFKAIYAFVHGENLQLPDDLKFAFIAFEQALRRDLDKWNIELEHRREAGKLGGLAKASNAKQDVANLASARSAKQNKQVLKNVASLADKVNVSVSVMEKVNENEIDNIGENEQKIYISRDFNLQNCKSKASLLAYINKKEMDQKDKEHLRIQVMSAFKDTKIIGDIRQMSEIHELIESYKTKKEETYEANRRSTIEGLDRIKGRSLKNQFDLLE